jgi:16S rRNA (cytidine1402-2'-O)-methyltransferase
MTSGTLYLVGTPIGNLGDMTARAREVLAEADTVACEDTRRTGALLDHFGIEARMVSFFEGNERERTPELVRALLAGRSVAVVSDAGMPGLSDPGFRLVRECVSQGISVTAVPGPSAVIAALVVSGLPTDRFVYEGFLPRRGGDRRARLGALAHEERTLVFFESPRRVVPTLEDMRTVFGPNRRVVVARELTKIHEEVIRGTVEEVFARVADREQLKGEVVLVLEGGTPPPPPELDALVAEARELVQGGMKKRVAAHEVAARHRVHANPIYDALLRP